MTLHPRLLFHVCTSIFGDEKVRGTQRCMHTLRPQLTGTTSTSPRAFLSLHMTNSDQEYNKGHVCLLLSVLTLKTPGAVMFSVVKGRRMREGVHTSLMDSGPLSHYAGEINQLCCQKFFPNT